MKKDIVKQLKKHADTLPLLMEMRGGSLLGSKLIEMGITEIDGAPVDPEATFKGRFPQPVNHYENLKTGFKKEGPAFISKYTTGIVNAYNEGVEAMNKQVALEKETKTAK